MRFSTFEKKSSVTLLICISGIALWGCRDSLPVSIDSETHNSSSSGGSSSSGSSSYSAGLYISVLNQYDEASTWIEGGNCQIPLGSAQGTSKNCMIHVPEARLYLSKTKFLVGTADTSRCAILLFTPYYYRGSTAAGFTPPWKIGASSVDCSTNPAPAACYNGPATSIISNFPTSKTVYLLTAYQAEHGFEVNSANSSMQTSNKWTCNSKSDKTAAIAGQYVANSMQDYVVECRDEYFEPTYTITMTLADDDWASGENPGGPHDNFSDWDGH